MTGRSAARGRLDPDALAALEEQRDFLLRSIADLDREQAAGDLTDEDAVTLRDDYTARAAEVLRSIESQEAAFAAAKAPRNPVKVALVAVGIALFAVVAGLAVASAMGIRKPGETASGGITVKKTTSQRANECSAQMTTDPDASFQCLEDVLDEDPTNAVALTWSAWQLALTAPNVEEPDRTSLQALSAIRLEQAVESDPNYSYARAFRVVVAYRNGRYEDARRFLEEFEQNNPSATAAQVLEQQDIEAKIDEALASDGSVPEN